MTIRSTPTPAQPPERTNKDAGERADETSTSPGLPAAFKVIEGGRSDMPPHVATGKNNNAQADYRADSGHPRKRKPDVAGLFVATIFASSIAGLAFAGVEMIRSNISQHSAVVFIGAWALIASFLLTLSYVAARQRKVAEFLSRSGLHMLCAAATFSSITIAAIMLAFMYKPAVGSIVHKTVESKKVEQEHSGTEVLSSFQKFKRNPPRFSEHFYTPPTPDGRPPFRRPGPALNAPVTLPVDPVLMQEVQKKLAASTIEPAAAKPDRKIKAEPPATTKKAAKSKKKKKRVVKKRKNTSTVKRKRKVAQAAKRPAQRTTVKATPLVIVNKTDELIDRNQPDCKGMKSVRMAECADR